MIRRGWSTNDKHLMILKVDLDETNFSRKIPALQNYFEVYFRVTFSFIFLDVAYPIPFADSNTIISTFCKGSCPPS